jgi:ABC-2 type transport system ATP-binding protein
MPEIEETLEGQRAATPDSYGPLVDKIIDVEGLEKRYGNSPVKAVDGVSFFVQRGEVFGLLGPNGAGKTTTIGTLTTRSRPTAGRVTISGRDVIADPVATKPYIAVVPQRNNLDRSLTALENLTFHATYHGIGRKEAHERAMGLLKEFGLADRAKERVDRYSGGLSQRLLIVRALMHFPEVLFLDEPTTGLDPQSRLFLWDTIQKLNRKGLTVFLTTHDMVEAERLCHRVAIMDRGKILALDTPRKLRQCVPIGTRVELKVGKSGQPQPSDRLKHAILDEVRSLPGVNSAEWTIAEQTVDEPMPLPPMAGMPAGGGPGFMTIVIRKDGNDGGGKPVAAPSGPPVMMLAGPGGGIPSAKSLAAGSLVDGVGGPPLPPMGQLMLRIYAEQGGEVAVKAARCILDKGIALANLHLVEPSLEDVFIHLTGRGLRN